MEQEMEEGGDDDEEEGRRLKVDLEAVKVERKSPGGDVGSENVEDTEMSPVAGSDPASPGPVHSPNSSGGDKPKLSAKEAHPNLLAHLMNGGSALKGQNASKLTMGNAPNVSPVGIPWNLSQQGLSASNSHHPFSQQNQQLQMFKHPTFSTKPPPAAIAHNPAASPSQSVSPVPASSDSGSQNFHGTLITDSQIDSSSSHQRDSPMLQHERNSSTESRGGKKGEFHAATVSNLKDKILRKYDSVENLQKISKSGSSPSPSPAHSILTSSQSSSALLSLASNNSNSSSNSPPLPAPISGRSNSTGTTEGLNKELATKLTICPLSAEASRSCSPQDVAVTATTRPSSVPSSSSQIRGSSPLAGSGDQSLTSNPHQSQNGSLFSRGLPHPASALSQIPQMLLSQGIHPANLPMYHSMLARGFPSATTPPAPSLASGGTSEHMPHNAPLASMQRFADFFNRGQIMEPGEKR